jgi:hypothetical protein
MLRHIFLVQQTLKGINMNLKNIIDKIDKELKVADAGLLHAEADGTYTHQFWIGYKQGLAHVKNILIEKIESRKKD